MGKIAKDWGPLHPKVEIADRLAKTDLPRERQLELYRYLKLTRAVEDRLGNLYRQGKVVGGLYSSRGQEATSVGSAYALAPQDVTFLRFCFKGTVLSFDASRKLDKEIVRLHWLTPDELRARRAGHRSPLVQKCVDDYLAGRNFPLEILSKDFS